MNLDTLRKLLNSAVYKSLSLIHNGEKLRKPETVKQGKALRAEAEEQLKLLNLIQFLPEFTAENLQRAIAEFDAQTEREAATS